MHPAPRSNGATACSHGWSGGAAKPADAEPVDGKRWSGAAPAGAEEM
jgi:hypothetical protein